MKKRKEGGGNDRNRDWDTLNSDFIKPIIGAAMVVTGVVAVVVLVADDATGFGVADDVLIPGGLAYISEGIILFSSVV